MVQWLSRWIHNPVFPGSNPGVGRLTQPSILPRSVKWVAVLLIMRKSVGVVRIVIDLPGELIRQ